MKFRNRYLFIGLFSIGILNASDLGIIGSIDKDIKVGDIYTKDITISNDSQSIFVDLSLSKDNKKLDLSSTWLDSNSKIKYIASTIAKKSGNKQETYKISAIKYNLSDMQSILNNDFTSDIGWSGIGCNISNSQAKATYTEGVGLCQNIIDIEQDRAYSITLKAKHSIDKEAAQKARVILQYLDENENALSKKFYKIIESTNSLKETKLFIPKAPINATKLKIIVTSTQNSSVTFDNVVVSSYAIDSQENLSNSYNLDYTISPNNSPRGATAALEGRVWYDKNANGIQDSSEDNLNIQRIRVHLFKDGKDTKEINYTDKNGIYKFENLEPEHNYSIKVDLPRNYKSFTLQNRGNDESKDSDVDGYGYSNSILLKAGDRYLDLDAGMLCKCVAWIDIEKHTNKIDADRDSGPKLIVGTKVIWEYIVKNTSRVKVNNIKVVDDKEGEISCPKDFLDKNSTMICKKEGIVKEGNYTNMATVTGKGDNNQSVADQDPSHYTGIKPSCIGNLVWNDKNANGIQDTNESGIAGVKVELLYSNGSPAKDINGSTVAPITTNSNGEYKFCNLDKGEYIVKITPPKGYFVSPKDKGGDDSKDSDIDEKTFESDVINLPISTEDMNWDAGLYKSACLGDYVWLDLNQNGIQDANESGVAGVKVELYQNNQKIAEQNTSSSGQYKFCNLKPGTYTVHFIKPNGYMISPKNKGGDDSKDSDADPKSGISDSVTLDAGDNNVDTDMGIYPISAKLDIEKSTNGVDADSGSGPTIKVGSKVTWEYLVKNSGNIKVKNIKVVDNKEGNITCPKSELNPGESMVCKKDGIAKEGLYENIATVSGNGDDNKTLTDKDPSHYTGVKTACLGDFIWIDLNKNGIQDSNESGLAGVKVELLDKNGLAAKDFDGKTIAPTITNSEGKYKFCNLKAGDYIIKVTAPNGYSITTKNQGNNDSKDSDIDPKSGKSDTITLKSGIDDMSWDGGLYPNSDNKDGEHNATACLGDYMWLDENLNGIQDANEPGVVGIKVELYNADTNTLIATTHTDKSGKYEFCNLKPGNYRVKFDQPNTYLFTYQNKGDDSKDSDVDTKGWSQIVSLEAGEKNYTIDAGIYCECDDFKVHPKNYKKLKATSFSIETIFGMLLFVIFATRTLKFRRD